MERKTRKPRRKLKPEEKVSFIEHLEELRYRLIVCTVAVLFGTILAFLFKERVFGFLAAPLLEALPPDNKQLVFTGLYEAFMVYLKASVLAGALISVPVIFYQLWSFISPGLYEKERRSVLPFVLCSSVFFVGGGIFGYYVVFPYGFRFFLGFANEFIQPLPTMREYLSFATRLLLAFGVVFELPIFIFFLARIGLVSPRTLRKGRRYAIPIVFTVAALLTPPDVVTQLFMALPLLALYEIGILVAVLFGKKPSEEDLAESEEDQTVTERPVG
jgi:sec-independent protein translocase protein TatC